MKIFGIPSVAFSEILSNVTAYSVVLLDPENPGTAADRAGIQINDEVVQINGEHVTDKYMAKINHIIQESLRLGEVELTIKRLRAGESMFAG